MARKRGRPKKPNGARSMTNSPQSEGRNPEGEASAAIDRSGKQKLTPKTPYEVMNPILNQLEIDESNMKKQYNGGLNIDLNLKKKQASYADIVKGSDIECELSYVPAEEINGQSVAKINKDDIIEDLGCWDQSIIVCVLGANPPLEIIDGYVRRIWKMYTIEDVTYLKERQFIVRFSKIEERDEALKRKYYYFDNKPVFTKAWCPGTKIDITELKDIPIWVQFPGLNMKYWSLTGLRKLGSVIGKPIRRDKATATRAMWAFARIQVEVQVQQDFPEIIHFADEEDRIISQAMEYEWKPTICSKCNKMGHIADNCRKSKETKTGANPIIRKEWRPKQKKNEANDLKKEKESTIEVPQFQTEVQVNLEDDLGKNKYEEDQEGFQEVPKRKSARRLTIDDLYKGGGMNDVPYTGHYPFLS
ncbi:unnamed protein product [Cuscuta campestris]|uniref:CCHC-type domain-containing protein n=1 Tax=Cuscuta campestris TaxID=132261 RepID=A0A484KHJ3_9ASTE|nr:unnamed protein product [Cuscuta campestris]